MNSSQRRKERRATRQFFLNVANGKIKIVDSTHLVKDMVDEIQYEIDKISIEMLMREQLPEIKE